MIWGSAGGDDDTQLPWPGYDDLLVAAVRTLTGWSAPNDEQEALRQEFVALLGARPTALARTGAPAHLTVGVVVLDPTHRHVLLTHHRKADAWFQLGGHLEPGDRSLRAGAAREAAEESGLPDLRLGDAPVQLDRHALGRAFGSCREHLDVRFAAVAPQRTPRVSSESLDVAWWPIDALPAEGSVRVAVAAAREAIATR